MMINKVRLQRKFNCKKKLNFTSHILLILRTQLIYQTLLIITICIINFNFHFHLSEIYTAEFWTSQNVVTSNFALAICALLIIPYTVFVQELKSLLIRDMHCSILGLHGLFCILWNKFEINILFLLFLVAVGGISAVISEIGATALEQRRLMKQIFEIEREDRNNMHFGSQINQTAKLTSMSEHI